MNAKPLPAWALADADSLIDMIQAGPRNAARDLIAVAIYHAHTKGTLEAIAEADRQMERTRAAAMAVAP